MELLQKQRLLSALGVLAEILVQTPRRKRTNLWGRKVGVDAPGVTGVGVLAG